MITHPAFSVEPWCIRERELHLDVLAQSESIFALANGHIGLRGNLDEGEPYGLPGTYLNSFYELSPLLYGESGYGFPESDETIINITDGKLIRLLVDDQPFDVRYGRLVGHERVLDFRSGTLKRIAKWISPSGGGVQVCSERLVSFTERSVAAICYEVEPIEDRVRLVVQSELVANEPLPSSSGDPRKAIGLGSVLSSEDYGCRGLAAELVHRTASSGLIMAAGMDHILDGPDRTESSCESYPDMARVTVTTVLEPGQKLRIVKLLSYGWSAERSRQAVRDQVAAALTGARHTGWEELLASQHKYLGEFWDRADVELDGDLEIQAAVRFGLFHVLQAGARAEGRAIPAKGLTGPGYDGHAFWDSETFVLPVLTLTAPQAVAYALRWRHSTLPDARQRAAELGLRGAVFPWRTIAGKECSGYWPAGTAAFHLGADIAHAVVSYLGATADEDFEREVGLELLVETARLWCSLGHFDSSGRFRIDGVTGPDEYSAVADNNVYTNLMAEQNLREAAAAAERHPERAAALGVEGDELARWTKAAAAMTVPFDERLGVHPQAEGFTDHEAWDFAATEPDQYPLMLHFPYFDLYRKQVVKQADLVFAMYLRGEVFSEEQKARNFAYYEALTVRDSSLSASIQSVLAAEIGHLDLAYDYLGEAALMDLYDLERNTSDGLHIASLAGSWISLVAGFGGLRLRSGRLCFAPRLPEQLSRLAFRICFRGRHLRVEVTPLEASYLLSIGKPLELEHYGEQLTVTTGKVLVRPVSPPSVLDRPSQPVGREPMSRQAGRRRANRAVRRPRSNKNEGSQS